MTFLSDEASRNGTGWKHQKEHYYECAVEKQDKLPCDTVETLRRGKKIIGEVGCGQAWFLQDPVDLIEKIWLHSLQVPCNSKHHWGIMIPKSWIEDGWIIALIYKQRGDTLPRWGPGESRRACQHFQLTSWERVLRSRCEHSGFCGWCFLAVEESDSWGPCSLMIINLRGSLESWKVAPGLQVRRLKLREGKSLFHSHPADTWWS